MTEKKEMNLEEMEKVAGGGLIKDGIEVVKDVVDMVKGGKTDKKDADQKETSGGGGTSYSNTNDGGKQMANQGQNNKNDNSGTMNW